MKQLIGGLMLAAGILIAGASGLCSLGVLASFLTGPNASGFLGGLLMVGLFGGLPFAGGVSLIIAGWALLRAPDGGTPPPRDTFGDER